MVFEGLAGKLQETFKKLKGKGKLSEIDIRNAMREVKLALLEADVNYKVVKEFINRVTEKANGKEVMESLTPAQSVIKIVHDELKDLMGTNDSKINFSDKGFTVIMMVGLQGAGKTTMAGKLALHLKKKNKKPMLCACDIYRPAAIKQLQVVGASINIPVFSLGDKENPVEIAKQGVEHAKNSGCNILIVDTAGRLHIDKELMEELKGIREEVEPTEILLVLDAMTGQDAVNVADVFGKEIDLTGIILTKLDSDTRGGAALSLKTITDKPIKFIGVGEKMNDLEVFYPDRMASRILGMGDVLSLIEKVQTEIDDKEAYEMGQKFMSNEFNFENFLDGMKQIKKLGPISKLMEMIPGVNKAQLGEVDMDAGEKQLVVIESIINSMTLKERRNAHLVTSSSSRKRRIAKGSGRTIQEVNRFLKDFENMKKTMKQFKGMEKSIGKRKGLFGKMPF